MRPIRSLTLVASLIALTHGTARAQTAYNVQPIARFGDKIGDLVIGGHFDIGGLNDNGQIAFAAESAAGGEVLFQYDNGKLNPIVIPGKEAPGGKWSPNNQIITPVSMNQLGNIVFGSDVVVGGSPDKGTFLWDFRSRKVTAVALRGMPAVDDRTFEQGASTCASINNFNDIAFAPLIKNAAGQAKGGIFLLRRDGTLLPIALPDQARPGGGEFAVAGCPDISDTMRIGFVGRLAGEPGPSSWLEEGGKVLPVAVRGADRPDGGKIESADRALPNNKNESLLVNVQVDAYHGDTYDGDNALYRYTEGTLTPIAVPGQGMPGGGVFKSVQVDHRGISAANEAGQHAFLARLADGSTAAYRVDVDGALSLLLKSGTLTDLGTITNVGVGDAGGKAEGVGIGFNRQGQSAVNVKMNDGVTTLILLTPTGR